MKYVVNEKTINANESFLVGHLTVSYSTLVEIFGQPNEGDGIKTDAEWVVEFEDGTVATIYNYKNGMAYLGRYGSEVEDITKWNIGGHKKIAATLIADIINQHTKTVLNTY